MKGSNKNFRTDFDDAWKDAFEGAEVEPPSTIWDRIDGNLSKSDLLKYKTYYKLYRGIAASVLLVGLSTALYFGLKESEAPQLAETPTEIDNGQRQDGPDTNGQEGFDKGNNLGHELSENSAGPTGESGRTAQNSQIGKSGKSGEGQNPSKNNAISDATEIREKPQPGSNNFDSNPGSIALEEGSTRATVENKNLDGLKEIGREYLALAPALVPKELALKEFSHKQVPSLHYPEESLWYNNLETSNDGKANKKAKDQKMQVFANVNLNSDFFNPNFKMNNPQRTFEINQLNSLEDMAASNWQGKSMGQTHTSQPSFTYGINLGMKVSGNWMLEGGVNYSNFSTATNTEVTVADFSRTEMSPITVQTSGRTLMQGTQSQFFNLTQDYTLNNSFEFASVPLRAGYIINISKFNYIIKAGVATDFFIRNEISDNQSLLNTVTNTPGDNSPFRRVFFNGSFGNELNYELNKNYSFSLEANYRLALNSFTKPDENFSSNPDSYGIGMIFRYHFN